MGEPGDVLLLHPGPAVGALAGLAPICNGHLLQKWKSVFHFMGGSVRVKKLITPMAGCLKTQHAETYLLNQMCFFNSFAHQREGKHDFLRGISRCSTNQATYCLAFLGPLTGAENCYILLYFLPLLFILSSHYACVYMSVFFLTYFLAYSYLSHVFVLFPVSLAHISQILFKALNML